MFTTIILILGLLITVGVALATRSSATLPPEGDRNTYGYKEERFNPAYAIRLAAIAFIFVLVAIFQPFSLSRVDAGHVGIKVNLTGDERGVSKYEYRTGWVVYNTITENLYEFPTFQQHVDYDTIQVITKGGFPASIRPTFNYSLIPNAVGNMFENLRRPIADVEQGWLKTAVVGSVNDVANKWPVDSIFNNREQFELAILAECNKRVSKWFAVSQLRSNIVPPPSLQAAIIAKTQSIQQAQAALQQVTVAEANGKIAKAKAQADSGQAVITAAGHANATLIEARADAEAIKLKQQQVTSTYVDYIRASNWDGKLPTTMLGGSNTLFSLTK